MTYEKEIVSILLQAGRRGLSVKKIAHHVHHEVNSLFEEVSYEEVYSSVRGFIWRHSRKRGSLFKHAAKYGYYRLNKNAERFRRLCINDEG